MLLSFAVNPGIKDVSQDKLRVFIHKIDHNDIIVDINEAWLQFALENDAPQLSHQEVVGRSLWTFISGIETRHLYSVLLKRIRQHQQRVVFTYRCDSPTLLRYIQMEIVRADNQTVEFRNHLLLERYQDPIRLLDVSAERTDELLLMCSWCNRIYCDQLWLPLEEAINYLGLFGPQPLPQITHGICPTCTSLLTNLA